MINTRKKDKVMNDILRTNLIATVCEFKRFVPVKERGCRQARVTDIEDHTFKYDTKGALANLLTYSIMDADDIGSGG